MKRQPPVRTREPEASAKARAKQVPVRQPQVVERKPLPAGGEAHQGNSQTEFTPEELGQMIATTAYYHAQQRGFAPGHELEDWLAAETEVRRAIGKRGAGGMAS